jgi:hypothetical protein
VFRLVFLALQVMVNSTFLFAHSGSRRAGAIPSTFEAAREIPSVYIVLCCDYSNSLDLYMVNLIEDSEKHELGPWHPELFFSVQVTRPLAACSFPKCLLSSCLEGESELMRNILIFMLQ